MLGCGDSCDILRSSDSVIVTAIRSTTDNDSNRQIKFGTRIKVLAPRDQAIFFATTTVMSSYCSRPPNSATLSTIALAISDAERDL
jgi:hypothetical protein